MLLLNKFCGALVLLVFLNYVNGGCPYASQIPGLQPVDEDIKHIYEQYMSAKSYNTYETECHTCASQPPKITDSIIDHGLKTSVLRTEGYEALDTLAGTGMCPPKEIEDKESKPKSPKNLLKAKDVIKKGIIKNKGSDLEVCPNKLLTDMDRNSFYFESSTKYIQETTCSSKSTTSVYLTTLLLDKFEDYAIENVTKVMCESGHIKYPSCSSDSPYRPVDGICNNLHRPLDGSVGDCMQRLLPADFKDGISQLKTSMSGSPLPNAKLLSTNLFSCEGERPLSTRYTQFHSFFGEFVIGDNGMTLNHGTGMLVDLQCCDEEEHPRVDHPQCAPFFTPPEENVGGTCATPKCMQFARSIPCARCTLGPRMIANSVTSAHDLNSVYGVSLSMLTERRTMSGGLLKTQTVNGHELFAVEKLNNNIRYRCFEGKCGLSPFDVRNVLSPTGLVFALLFHKNHNRHALKIAALKPKWSDEEIFQEARKWNIAEYQHVVYNEYLETLIGAELTEYFGILPKPLGQFSNYESGVQLKTTTEFQTTAGRQGHTTLAEEICIIEPKTGNEYEMSLQNPDVFHRIFYSGLVDGMLLAQMSKPAFETTPSIPFKTFILNKLGLDLAALDIQRQRDHGMPGYINYVKLCHGVEISEWEDLLRFIDSENIEKLKENYECVEDIELYVGGHYERKIGDATLGHTFASIIGNQFYNAKYGDRFFYEHCNQTSSFSIEQLNEIKEKSCFAHILCKNTNLEKVLAEPLRLKSYTNKFVQCSELGDFDYKL